MFEVEAPEIATKAKPGQFIIVIHGVKGERIPLTISAINPTKGTVTFAFHEVGKTTKELATMNEGETITNITGPLGNPSEIKKFGKVLCVGGSVMIAPLLLQSKAMREAGNSVTTVLGARSEEFLMLEEEGKAVSDEFYVSTDDGTKGYQGLGFLDDLLKKEKFDRVVAWVPLS